MCEKDFTALILATKLFFGGVFSLVLFIYSFFPKKSMIIQQYFFLQLRSRFEYFLNDFMTLIKS